MFPPFPTPTAASWASGVSRFSAQDILSGLSSSVGLIWQEKLMVSFKKQGSTLGVDQR